MSDLFPGLPIGGNWEGGFTDSQGRRWHHVPHRGWTVDRVFIVPVPRRSMWARVRAYVSSIVNGP